MNEHIINQTGDKSVYIEHNTGAIYVSDYVADPNEAFTDQSFELQNYAPKIQPPIQRDEVGHILDWIAKDTDSEKPNRVALLYGSAGIGKSVVMHDVLLQAQQKADYLVLGLKTDQIEFTDSEHLRAQMHLAKPILAVIKDMAQKNKRVVLLIDQIDALSLSLSSNRTPLRSIFERVLNGHLYNDFTIDVTNKLIDDFLKNIDTEETQVYLKEFSHSIHEGFVFVSLYVYTQHPKKYFNDIYSLVTQRKVLVDAPSWVEYQALEALKVSFTYMTDEQQKHIVHLAETLTDKGEYRIFDKEILKRRMECGFSFPILDIDIHRGRVLHALPVESLKHYSWNAYQERLRIERKYAYNKNGKTIYPRLENEEPRGRSSVMSGWTSVGVEKAEKMDCKSWYISMTKYTDNLYTSDWKRPSLMGQCQLFRNEICKNPDKYLGLLKDIVTDGNISFAYVEAGMNGLLDAKRYQEAEFIFSRIVNEIRGDVNSSYRDFDIHSFLYAIEAFVKADYLPQVVFDFLCNAVVNVKESKVNETQTEERDIYNAAINQARGHAAYLLVKCSEFEEYKVAIFDTIEKIAMSASVYTRSAILLNLAVLNHLDKERNVGLFKLLMHDYDVRLMSMPVHNYNPLVYFINYAIDDLMEFFTHASENPKCYREQVIVLWLAWTHNNHRKDIKHLLDKMCYSESQEARLSLMGFLSHQDNDLDEDAVEYIVSFMTGQYNSPELGKQCDMMFHYANNWSANHKVMMANAYVKSPLCVYENRGFVKFLAGYAVVDPLKTLSWLEQIVSKKHPEDYGWNLVTDVLIQSYLNFT